MFFSR